MRTALFTQVQKIFILVGLSCFFSSALWAADQINGIDFGKKNQQLQNQTIAIGSTDVSVRFWAEVGKDGSEISYYEIFRNEKSLKGPLASSFDLKLRYDTFDPLSRVPAVEEAFAAGPESNVYIVQFVTQTLDGYRDEIEAMGGTIGWFLPNHCHIVAMEQDVFDAVAQLPFVRWVGPYHPAYRLEGFLLDHYEQAQQYYPLQEYNIMVSQPGLEQKTSVAERILAMGGVVDNLDAGKYLLRATLTPDQLFDVMRFDEVLFIDRWGPYEVDMNNAREYGGANYIETTPVPGYTGQGVRGESFDTGFNVAHVDLQNPPLIIHVGPGSDSHGAACIGICFGDGTGNADARGLLPDGQGIVALYSGIMGTASRYGHTGELVQPPYEAVFQTASVGSPRTFFYETVSADTDAALFDFDVVHCQSQSNAGNQDSRPEAWAKNIISGGGVYHYDTLDPGNDCWCGGGSTGPGQDGRIKPDLCAYYDDILTTTTGGPTSYTTGFGGTSGATPIICGHSGLVFQMWADLIFENSGVIGATVFKNRCHMTTAKALMINTANQYTFSGTGHDLTRVHQGWGFPSLENMYDLRENFLIINEDDVLENLQSASYQVQVQAGEPALRATLVFADPPGDPAASEARINDLTLKVTSPSMVEYWGNNGLLEGNWSTPGGAANTVDTVECVFVENPEVGSWTIEVFADEVNEDSHVETPAMDADFALVVSGADWPHYSMRLSPPRIGVCAPDEAVFTIDLTGYEGYAEQITLSATGNPTGTTVGFSQNPVTLPATVTMTVGNTAGGVPGSYVLDVAGTSVHRGYNLLVDFDLNTAAPGAVNLTAPADGSVDQAMQPTFTWDAVPQALDYDFDLADDAGFTNIIHNENLTANTLQLGFALQSLTQYYWRVRANNICGDSGYSPTFSFTTIDQPDYMTELFAADNDLDNRTAFFVPNGVGDYYYHCSEVAAALPTDPAGGTTITLTDDDNELVTLANPVILYGVSYSEFYVGSNGFVTFTAGDTVTTESLANHFDLPRVSGIFDDLNPADGGTVSVRELGDRVAVTYDGVPEYSVGGSNTFQIEFFFNEEIHITWLDISATDGLAGLSQGFGVPGDFLETDLSAEGDCDPAPPLCVGDVDDDGDVDPDDFDAAIPAWRSTLEAGDTDGNGLVDLIDLLWLMNPANHGNCL